MALNTPIEIPPGLVFNSKKFDTAHFQQISPGGRGFIQTITRGDPAWIAEFRTPPLRDERYDEAIAFFGMLDGSEQTFLAYDPRRIMPRAYQHLTPTNDPWTQPAEVAPRVTGFSHVASTISLDRMANGAVVTAGDYISFKVGLIWYLFRAMETEIAVGNAISSLTVKPRPNISGTLPVNIRYRRACCAMKIIGGVREEDNIETFPSFQFRAVQFFDRSTP
jgi:hypothetical protein